MATDTFLRLPREKQERFLRAAWNEFTSCPYESVSINRIIQAAQVSRGSFYQYFSGKHDLFIYLLKNLIDTASRLFLAQMTVHQDDIFEAILGMYDMIVWQAASPKPDQPQARLAQLFRLNPDLEGTQFTEQLDLDIIGQQTRELLERQGCRVADHEVQPVLHLILSIGFTNLVAAMRCPKKQDVFRRQMLTQLEILRRGLTPGAAQASHP